jgi:glycosyltransferase involved in cell wall biosynthesis
VYNGARFLAEAVESVYAQTRSPDEVIVLDDGSTDETPQVLAELAAKYPLRQVRQANAGEAASRNRLVEMARGELIAFLDHDDLWYPRKLERQVEHIAGFDFSWTAVLERGSDGWQRLYDVPDWRPENAFERFTRQSWILTPSAVLVRRDVLAARSFEPVKPFGTDWLMWLRLAEAGLRMDHLPEPLTVRRWHGDNMSTSFEGWLPMAGAVFERLGNRRCLAWWHLEAAIEAKRRGDRRRSRKHIITAARTRPASVRPGWVRLLA